MKKLIILLLCLVSIVNADEYTIGKAKSATNPCLNLIQINARQPASFYPNCTTWQTFKTDDGTNYFDLGPFNNSGIGTNLTKNPTWTNFGGGSIYLTRTSGKGISFGDVDWFLGNSMFTISFWMYKQNNTSVQRLISKIRVNNEVLIQSNPDQLQVAIYQANATPCTFLDTGIIALNTWTHVAMVFNLTGTTTTNQIALYTNGIQCVGTYGGSVLSSIQNTSEPLTFGCGDQDVGSEKSIEGYLDDMKVWTNTVLTSNQVLNLYLLGKQ